MNFIAHKNAFAKFILLLVLLLGIKNSYAQTANFTINTRTGCVPLGGINFTDISSGGGGVLSRDWNLGNGTVIANGAAIVGTNYLTAQKFYVTLTVRFFNGITLTKLDSVIVYPKPVANFSTNDTIGCLPHAVNFTSLSTTATGTIASYIWDFGAGGSTLPAPSFTYNTLGQYNVSLIVKNSWGCESNAATKPQYIKVFSPPSAYFTVSPNYTCGNSLTAVFTNATTGGDPTRNTYEWDFGDLSPVATTLNATHSYSGTGNYTATLKVKLGNTCVSTYTYPIYIGKPTGTITTFPTTDVCVNTPINFVGTATSNNYYSRWYFSDNGQTQYYENVNHTFSTPGTFELLFISRGFAGCEDTVRRNITVKSGPSINFTPDFPNAACIPHTVTFTNNTIGDNLKFAWNYGNGSPVDTINGNGNATHQYTAFGTYQVTVYAKDTSTADGCFAYKTYNYIRIYQPSVTLAVVPPSGCLPLPVTLNASVYNPAGTPITNYTWNFGDGSPTSTTTLPTKFHLYTTAGSFPATVTINMQDGCSYTSLVKTVSVIALCDDDGSGGGGAGGGGFLITKTCADKYTITFTDTVTNNIVTSWDFGDGTGLYTTPTPLSPYTYTYTPPQKIYTVIVTRLDTLTNIVSTAQKRIIIIDEKANFVPNITDICKNKTVNFSTIGIDSSLIKTYTWSFGDGTPNQIINNAQYFSYYGLYLNGNTSHTYADTGVFYVKLYITDKLGCIDSFLFPTPITVKGPQAGFFATPLTSCTSPLFTTITDTSIQNGSTPIVNWEWSFGDGTVLNTNVDSVLHHNYTGTAYANFYTITLKITDAIGCEATVTKSNYIRIYKPKADFFSYDTLRCGNRNVFLYNYSASYNGTFVWHYGDGTTSNSYYGSHTYAADGMYNIKLVTTDENGCKDSITKPNFIKIIKPIADFRVGDTTRCAPTAIQFFDSSRYAATYAWNFGDGGTGAVGPNPAPHIYAVPGLYKVVLKITGTDGCTDTTFKWIRVRGPIGNLTGINSNGCKPKTINLNVAGSFISTYAWDYNDGTPVNATTTGASVSHVYNNAGMYLPNVVLTSPEGCPFTLSVADTIFVDSAKAKFLSTPSVFCGSGGVDFTNQSSVPAFSEATYRWVWGDGTADNLTANPPTHTYNTPGTYTVKLFVFSKYGCVDSVVKTALVKVSAIPTVSITGNNVACLKPASTLQYNSVIVSADPIASYNWKIDGVTVATTANLNYNYRIPGAHIISLLVTTTNNCSATASKNIIIDSVKTNFTIDQYKFCGSGTVNFGNSTNSFTTPSYIWSFGDGTTSTSSTPTVLHLYNTDGIYSVKLFAQNLNGCKDSTIFIDTIKVYKIPAASINGSTVNCLVPNSTLQYTSSNTGLVAITAYEWKIDGGATIATTQNLNYNYRVPGNHILSLKVTTANNCDFTITKNIIIDSVKTNFTIDQYKFCGSGTVNFGNSTNSFTTPSYIWSFGDGTTSTSSTPTVPHLYNSDGIYSVKLFAQNLNGCKDSTTFIDTIKVYKIPLATINGSTVNCLVPNSTLQFTSSNTGLVPITAYEWKIDGGATIATTQNLNYNYRVPGNHVLSLKVTTANNCDFTVTKNIIIDSVKTNFTIDQYKFCGSGTVNFGNTTTSYSTPNFKWTFGNANSSTSSNATVPNLYNTDGIYSVKLFAQNLNGCKDSTTFIDTIKVYKIPVATINGAIENCLVPNSTLLYTSTNTGSVTITAYEWKIDGGATIATTQNLNYNYRVPGNHVLSLKVTTANNCNFTVTKNIIIDSVKTNFTIDQYKFCGSGTVNFVNITTSFTTPNYIWSFGDGTTSTSSTQTVPHLYNSDGIYTVKLFAQNLNGCKDSTIFIDTIKVYKIPAASINGTNVNCLVPNSTLQYTSSNTGLVTITAYEWKINNGATIATTQNLNYNYRVPGNHVLSLKVTTANNCDFTITKNIIIDSVKTNFIIDQYKFCGSGTVNFGNTTNSFSTPSYIWSFGDGTTATSSTPTVPHLYNTDGIYSVKLFAQNLNGCKDSTTFIDTIKVYKIPAASINGSTVNCLVPNSTLQYTSSNTGLVAITAYEWKIDGGATIATTQNLNYNYRVPGNHVLSLKVTTANNCSSTITKNIIIDSVKTNFSFAPKKLCGQGLVTFTNLTTSFGNITYTWNYGDGSSGTGLNPTHFYNMVDTFTIALTGTTVNGCTSTTTLLDTLKVFPKTTVSITGQFEKCAQNKLIFKTNINTYDPITSYNWKLNNNSISIVDTAFYNFTTAGNYTIQLNLTTLNGCVVQVDSPIIIRPLPIPNAKPDTTICLGATIPLRAYDGVTYAWSPIQTIQNPNQAFTNATPIVSTNYFVTVTNQYGCVQKDTVNVIVKNPVNLQVSAGKKICIGESTTLTASGNAASFLWSPAASLSNTSGATTVATPTSTTLYSVTGFSGTVCTNETKNILIEVGNIPTVNAGPDQTVANSTTVQLQGSSSLPAASFLWTPSTGLNNPNISNPTFIADKTTTYKFLVRTDYGCTNTDEITVYVLCGKGNIFIPNAFTPNGDNVNDVFYVKGYGLSSIKKMLVYNRYGEIVFQRQNFPTGIVSLGWDGKVKGQEVPITTAFVYQLEVECTDGKVFPINGTIILIR